MEQTRAGAGARGGEGPADPRKPAHARIALHFHAGAPDRCEQATVGAAFRGEHEDRALAEAVAGVRVWVRAAVGGGRGGGADRVGQRACEEQAHRAGDRSGGRRGRNVGHRPIRIPGATTTSCTGTSCRSGRTSVPDSTCWIWTTTRASAGKCKNQRRSCERRSQFR